VTLKSFRKIVGFDTFNSILRKERNEKKDLSDYYNVTVSMMVQRTPVAAAPVKAVVDGQALAGALDKGFPYDDADITSLTERAKPLAKQSVKTMIGQLDGHNISKDALRNLITDKAVPLTTNLAQKTDGDILSALFDANVTRGALKNLVTDKPSPITQKLAQKTDGDILSALFDANVTRGALKNLVTDKPSPITQKLA
jgi:hypothetical protein